MRYCASDMLRRNQRDLPRPPRRGPNFERLGMQAVVRIAIFVFILALGQAVCVPEEGSAVGHAYYEGIPDALGTVRATVYNRLRKLENQAAHDGFFSSRGATTSPPSPSSTFQLKT